MRHAGTVIFLLALGLPGVAHAEIDSEPVSRETLTETIRLDGMIEAVQESTVSAQTSGTVLRLPYDVDDSVTAGDLIVKLEDSEQRARLDQAQGNLQEAKANYRNAQQQFDRIEEVYDEGYVSRQEFDQAQNNLAAAEARLERSQAALEEARKQLDYTTVVAPYSGILTERHVEVGESVNPGQPLLSGLSLEELRVVVELPQKYADAVRAERTTRVTLADGRVLKTGEMTFYPYADAQTHTFRLRLALEEPEATLYPGMLVKVEAPASQRQALWIPDSSLIRRSELRAVYVLDQEGRPRLRQIRTGISRSGRIEVLAGLDEGESVITNPAELLGSGQVNPGTSPSGNPSRVDG
ncbi:MAG: efflux RND transporter periplasmic adaptor subunit [Oleiphilaceae bacterium]|nr:efflux RND transporter periplasmic adaptor subunit [Oleiphilaceae bacterium]